MKSPYAYIGTGLLVFLICLVLSCPAPLLYQWQRAHIDPRVHVYAPQGTLWHGSAALVDFSGLQLSSVKWQFRPFALLLGRISHRVEAQSMAGPVSTVITRSYGSTSLSDLHGSFPVGQLAQALRLPVPPLTGQLDVSISGLAIIGTGLETARGTADLNSLAWPLSTPPIALGNYHAEFNTEKDVIKIALTDSAGQIEMKGNAEIATPTGIFSVDVRLRPRAAAPAGVVNLIQQLGNADSDGWYRLRREGAF